jgi:phage tail sheath protein FI
MPEYLTPGVYVEEVSTNKTITGVGTSTAGFVGVTERGPKEPQCIDSPLEFHQLYGGYIPQKSYLAYAVAGFFANGGQRCFVARAVHSQSKFASIQIGTALNIVAIGPGAWGNDVFIKISQATQAIRAKQVRNSQQPAPPPSPQESWVKVTIEYQAGGVVKTNEIFDDLTHDTSVSNNIQRVINANSRLIRVWWQNDTPRAITAANVKLANGDDGGAPLTAEHYSGANLTPIEQPAVGQPPEDVLSLEMTQGLAALKLIDEVALVIVPDEVHQGLADEGPKITQAVINHCSNMKDRFAILSTQSGKTDLYKVLLPDDTTYAAIYYPWIKVADPETNRIRAVPPAGHIAGICARSDIERGVHKAPANEVVREAIELEFPVTKQMQDILNPRGINCIRDFRSDGRGILIWGARTMSSNPEWRYVNVKRFFLFLEESIHKGTQWVVFEPNDEPTWLKVKQAVENFLYMQWRNGALMGAKPQKAYFVRCDRSTMTPDDIDNGRLICLIGVAPVKPAEFVIFRISHMTGM